MAAKTIVIGQKSSRRKADRVLRENLNGDVGDMVEADRIEQVLSALRLNPGAEVYVLPGSEHFVSPVLRSAPSGSVGPLRRWVNGEWREDETWVPSITVNQEQHEIPGCRGLDELPAEVAARVLGERETTKAELKELFAMATRTAGWIRSDAWQADLLPQMVDHGSNHGRRVDQLSNQLFNLSNSFRDLPTGRRMFALASLSGASWLHDIGQRGGTLPGEPTGCYLSDPHHVRNFHGAISRQVINSHADDLGLNGQLGSAVALLSFAHQRIVQIGREAHWSERKKCGRNSCDACEFAEESLYKTTFTKLLDALPNGNLEYWQRERLTPLAAILRIADASDINFDRVAGRWETGQHNIEDAWKREFVDRLVPAVPNNDTSIEAQHRRKVRGNLLAPGGKDWTRENLKAWGLHKMQVELALDFLSFLNGQTEHVKKHLPFTASRIEAGDADHDGRETFRIVISRRPEYEGTTDEDINFLQFRVAAYIWGEYRDSEDVFEGCNLPRLDAVIVGEYVSSTEERDNLLANWGD